MSGRITIPAKALNSVNRKLWSNPAVGNLWQVVDGTYLTFLQLSHCCTLEQRRGKREGGGDGEANTLQTWW